MKGRAMTLRWAGLVALLLAIVVAAGLSLAGGSANAAFPITGQAQAATSQVTFRGNVYKGSPLDTSTPLSGVTVTLYGSDDANVWGDTLNTDTTGAAGGFNLTGGLHLHGCRAGPAGHEGERRLDPLHEPDQ